MARIRLSSGAALVAGVALFLTGCPDTEGANDDFVSRTEEFRPGGDRFPDAAVVEPAGFFDVTGSYMLAIAADVDPSKPLLFIADVVVDASDDMNPTIQITLTALTADEARVPVGDSVTTEPQPLNREDGKFEVDFGRVMFDGASDPILPGQAIEADLVLTGQTNGESEICGTVSGQILQPAMLPLGGSFGTTPATGADAASKDIVSLCSAGE